MRVVYVDTGALIGLIWQRDQHHERVVATYRRLQASRDALLTTNLVIAETATRLRYDAGLPVALRFREALGDIVASGRLVIRYVDSDLSERAWETMAQYADLTLSFADCAGAVAAREAKADAVFGLDSDFLALGFALEP